MRNLIPNLYYFKFLKALLLRLEGVDVGIRDIFFNAPLYIDRPKNVILGKGIFINRNCHLEGLGKINIGNNVHIASNVVIATSGHKIKTMEVITKETKIKDNVWIGANSVICPGISIGPNVIVGAGSIVTKDFSDCVVVGNPANKIREYSSL